MFSFKDTVPHPLTVLHEQTWRLASGFTGDELDRVCVRSNVSLNEATVEKLLQLALDTGIEIVDELPPESNAKNILQYLIEEHPLSALHQLGQYGLTIGGEFYRPTSKYTCPWALNTVVLVANSAQEYIEMLDAYDLEVGLFQELHVINGPGEFIFKPEIHRVVGKRQLFVVYISEEDIELRELRGNTPLALALLNKQFSRDYMGVDFDITDTVDILAYGPHLVKDRRKGGVINVGNLLDHSQLMEAMQRTYGYDVYTTRAVLRAGDWNDTYPPLCESLEVIGDWLFTKHHRNWNYPMLFIRDVHRVVCKEHLQDILNGID